MGRAIALKLIVKMVLLAVLLHPKAQSHWEVPESPAPPINPTPLCASQFALVNHACAMLPYTQVPPPSPPSPDGPDGGHGHRRRHGKRETPAEEECCRWLKDVDSVCVCELLVHLPPFLTRPVHNYTVVVDDTCDVSFECGSRWVRV